MEGGAIKLIFKGGRVSFLQWFCLVLIAFSLMFLQGRSERFRYWVSQASVITYPFKVLVDSPVRFGQWLITTLKGQQTLINQNATLRANDLLLQSKLQKMLIIEKENQQLYHLLQSSAQITGQVKVSRILAIDLKPSLHQVIIGSGRHEGLYIGQPVLDAYGIFGQVVAVGPLTSRVLMITDKRFAIPVKDYRNGLRFIAEGNYSHRTLSLLNVTRTNDIKKGDMIVSSGVALRFPVGYPVGKVINITRYPGNTFVQVRVLPSAHLNQTQQVLLAWPKQANLRKEVMAQLAAPLVASKEKK